MPNKVIVMLVGALLGIGCGGGPFAPEDGSGGSPRNDEPPASSVAVNGPAPHVLPTIPARAAALAARAPAAAVPAMSPNGIDYHGGPVIRAPIVFYIWYGAWTNNTAPDILTDFAKDVGGSPYFDINAGYGDASGPILDSVVYGGSTSAGFTHGTSLTDDAITQIVADALTSGALPIDPEGIYYVLTPADVAVDGFCSAFCGWHTHATIAGTDIKLAFVGNPDACPGDCEAQTTSPNGNAGADGMASIIAHELNATASDPDINAWFSGALPEIDENADKCAWTFGQEYQVPAPPTAAAATARANTHLGDRDYLIETNWLNANGGACANGVLKATTAASEKQHRTIELVNANISSQTPPPGS
jgi:hypothetical protein